MFTDEIDESMEVQIQWTDDAARNYLIGEGVDEDSNEFKCRMLSEIGGSCEYVNLDSWADMPPGYEPTNHTDVANYSEYLENLEYSETDDDE